MSSVRIDLTGGGGLCGSGVDRSKPALLSSYMQDHEWERFCDGIDAALRPVALGMKVASASVGATFLATVVVGMKSFTSFSKGFGEPPSFDDDGFGFKPPSFDDDGGVSFVVPAAFMGVTMLSFGFAAFKAGQSREEMNRVCREVSARHPRLSFHVRYERIWDGYRSFGSHDRYGRPVDDRTHGQRANYRTEQYIEVSIDGAATAEAVGYVPSSAPSAPPATLEARLGDLEMARHLLTADEYDKRRADILTPV